MIGRKGRGNGLTRREFLRAAGVTSAGLCLAGWGAETSGATAESIKSSAFPVPALKSERQDIVIGIGSDVHSVDLRVTMGGQNESQIMHVLEPLHFPAADGASTGILAESWEPLSDRAGWRFHLRPGITFQNGEPMNAEAVKYSFDSVISEDWVHPDPKALFAPIQDIQIVDDLTVDILTDTFHRSLPSIFTLRGIVPPVYGAEMGSEFGQHPYGTGHYKFVEYSGGQHLLLEADRDYAGTYGGVAQNDTLEFRYFNENATRVAALEAGEVHLIDNLPPDVVGRIQENPDLEVLSVGSNRVNGAFMNCGREPFNNLNARLAVAHAIDKQAIVDAIMGGLTTVVDQGPFSPGTLGQVGESFAPFDYDLAKAKQYFKDAGLTNGTKIKVGGPIGRYTNDKQVMTAVASMLAEVGFDPELEQLEWGSYWAKASEGEYDLFYVGWVSRNLDIAEFKQVYMGWGDDNAGLTHFVEQNDRILELWETANSSMDMAEVEGRLKELSHLVWDNVAVAQIMYEPSIYGASKSFKGWTPRPDTYMFFWDAYLG